MAAAPGGGKLREMVELEGGVKTPQSTKGAEPKRGTYIQGGAREIDYKYPEKRTNERG